MFIQPENVAVPLLQLFVAQHLYAIPCTVEPELGGHAKFGVHKYTVDFTMPKLYIDDVFRAKKKIKEIEERILNCKPIWLNMG